VEQSYQVFSDISTNTAPILHHQDADAMIGPCLNEIKSMLIAITTIHYAGLQSLMAFEMFSSACSAVTESPALYTH